MVGRDFTSPAWLAGGGEMGGRLRAKDWSASPLGHPETWSQSVKTAVSICLNSRVPIALCLSPELTPYQSAAQSSIPMAAGYGHRTALSAALFFNSPYRPGVIVARLITPL
jgi:hypothetical protein